jgi:hypothetical protein
VPLDLTSPEHYTAFAFIAPLVLIYDRLCPAAEKRLAGSLQGGLNTDQGLRPLQNEIEVATHLMQSGFDIAFNDLEGGSPGFDFLAARCDVELEVECKSVSGDLGRQVHERRMAQVSDAIMRRLPAALDGVAGGRLVRVTIPARLPSDGTALAKIADSVKAAVEKATPVATAECKVEVSTFELAASPFSGEAGAVTREEVRTFVNERLGIANPNAFVMFAPRQHAVVVVVESEKRDRVVDQLLDTLKDAAKGQFSGDRAAVLVVQFLELDADAMLAVAQRDSTDAAKASALQIATNLYFQSTARSHIHTVVYRSHGTVMSTAADVQERGPTYVFTNPSHPRAGDARYRPFAIKKDGNNG